MSRITSYAAMFSATDAQGAVVGRVEIPLIQRDYAQGRMGAKVEVIRRDFLDVLYRALAGSEPEPVALDFVYGELDAHGALQPLDGQQRLTTLFLLHWYIAARAGQLDEARWTQFSYETRPSARRFCERLARARPPQDVTTLSRWIQDQPWYLFVWHHDPTIESMLVMLDAIHARFAELEPNLTWERLVNSTAPAISFHLLPLPDMGSAEDLYIKMNSRGKPLTEFENFKAHLEKTLEESDRAADFGLRIDTVWTDVFWRFRGDDNLIDDELLRYLEFVTEVCEWTDGSTQSEVAGRTLSERAAGVFGATNPQRDTHIAFLCQAFDVWCEHDVTATFEAIFRPSSSDVRNDVTRLPLFFRDTNVNLFESCCRSYGITGGGGNREFTFGQTLLLLAVVLHLVHGSADFPRRVRVLRNLVEGSPYEMRADRMPRLVADTRSLILNGSIPEAGHGFSLAQIDDETAKAAFLDEHNDSAEALDRLEDHELLRGSVGAFELDPVSLPSRSDTFALLMGAPDLWWDVTGSLLATGEYQRAKGRDPSSSRNFQFAPRSAQHADFWRILLTGATRKDLAAPRQVLGHFLDKLSGSELPLAEAIAAISSGWLAERERAGHFDWRTYVVKYKAMREGDAGVYFAEDQALGYSLCNLRGGNKQVNSWYRDPYLLAIWRELGNPAEVDDPWYIGYEWNPRFLTLNRSGTGLRAVATGFVLTPPTEEDGSSGFETACAELDIGDDLTLFVAQGQVGEALVDSEDRIKLGAKVLRRLLAQGL